MTTKNNEADMRAVIFPNPGPADAPDALIDVRRPRPAPAGREILVRVRAVAVNPVDYKSRLGMFEIATGGSNILGWDAAGIVEAVGPDATLFRPGDEVYYAGALERAGSNAEFQVVDERIVGPKPGSLSFAEAAALPLTTLTAWEMLFDRFQLRPHAGVGRSILVIGAAGGVGSIAVQIARHVAGLRVIGTASRPETVAWVEALGADAVLDHSRPLGPQLEAIGAPNPDYIFVTNGENDHAAAVGDLVAPQGRIGFIIPPAAFDLAPLFDKSASVHLEFMYTRHLHGTADMEAQHRILTEAARLVDAGVLRSTMAENYGAINAANLLRAHRSIESGKAKGKIVLEGF